MKYVVSNEEFVEGEPTVIEFATVTEVFEWMQSRDYVVSSPEAIEAALDLFDGGYIDGYYLTVMDS